MTPTMEGETSQGGNTDSVVGEAQAGDQKEGETRQAGYQN